METLPTSATNLIALIRVAHRDGRRDLEEAARNKLAQDFGLRVSFVCCESVDEQLGARADG